MCPEDIELRESLGSIDQNTNRMVAFDKPVNQGGKGWYFLDTGESSLAIMPMSVSNEKLFKWLEEKTNQYGYKE
jgi:hypothetical protein